MAILRKFHRFFGSNLGAPKGLLSRIKKVLDQHSDFLEAIEGEDGIDIRRNFRGGITISGGGEGFGSGSWSGFVWFLGALMWDFSKEGALPDGDDVGLSAEGVYLKIKLADGSTSWVDEIDTDTDTHDYFPVGLRSGAGTEEDPYSYSLSSGRVVGDIRIDLVPHMSGEAL